MDMYITIHSNRFSLIELQQHLASILLNNIDTRLEVKRFRALETTVLVAVVGALGTGLGALISGILKVAAEKGNSKIVLQGRTGWRIEVPADCPQQKINEYVELAKSNDIKQIEI